MALLTDDMIDKLEKLLIEEGLIESHVFEDVKKISRNILEMTSSDNMITLENIYGTSAATQSLKENIQKIYVFCSRFFSFDCWSEYNLQRFSLLHGFG